MRGWETARRAAVLGLRSPWQRALCGRVEPYRRLPRPPPAGCCKHPIPAARRRWVVANLDVARPSSVNLFETTIRVLGGLLSAHHLAAASRPALARGLAEKAAALGARLMPGFDSPSGQHWAGWLAGWLGGWRPAGTAGCPALPCSVLRSPLSLRGHSLRLGAGRR